MSWDDYIEQQLISTESVDEAMILSRTDGTVWASTENFIPRAYMQKVMNDAGEEVEKQVNEAEDLVEVAYNLTIPKHGLRINEVKYTPIRKMMQGSEDDGLLTLYFKRVKGGGCLVATNQAIIIGTFDETKEHTSQHCNLAVENLGRYLKENNF